MSSERSSTSSSVLPLLALILSVSLSNTFSVDAAQRILTIEPTQEQTRNSEGDIVKLTDGRLALVYSRFTGGSGDHAAADLAIRTSDDNGQTWSPDRLLVENEGGKNVMSVSILRLANGELLLFYMRKNDPEKDCRTFVRRSNDEFETVSEPTLCMPIEGYQVMNNDRAIQLHSGRILLPTAHHTRDGKFRARGVPLCYISDDDGHSWRAGNPAGDMKIGERPVRVYQEPGVVELKDNRLWMYMRTYYGYQYGCYSTDQGETWTEPQAILGLPSPSQPPDKSVRGSPTGPATIERNPWTDELIAVWNDHSGWHRYLPARRTPLCLAVSRDEGETWGPSRVIEGDLAGWFCYTSMSFIDDKLYLSYCAGGRDTGGLNRLAVTAIERDWLNRPPGTGQPAK